MTSIGASRFLDTNVLLYAYDQNAPEKRRRAMLYLEQAWNNLGSTAISVQVLQEFHVNAVRMGMDLRELRYLIEDFCHWPGVDNSIDLLGRSMDLYDRWQISLWDALVLAAAEMSGASELISEDLNHEQYYGTVQVINPFRV